VLGEVRSRWPDMPISLHLHDTRGLAVANAHAGLKMGSCRCQPRILMPPIGNNPLDWARDGSFRIC
jgi:hypothetical protein